MTCPGCSGSGFFQIRTGSGAWIKVKCLQCRGTGRLA
jgi:DnaJ-class molecular chaperone